MLTPDSEPWSDTWIYIYEQKSDAVGNPSLGKQVGNGSINLQGEVLFNLEDGLYSVCPPDLGYGWAENGCVYNIQVLAGSQTTVKLQPGKLELAIVGASGIPWEGVWAYIYTQKQNAVGEPVTANQVWNGNTNNAGTLNAWLTPGTYAIEVDLRGYNWGELADTHGRANVIVSRGVTTMVVVKMGQIVVGLTDSGGSPRKDVWMYIYTQKNDVNGNPVPGNQVWNGRTDNGGLVTIDLTEGLYAIEIDDELLYNVPVNWGVVTQTDGKTYHQNK